MVTMPELAAEALGSDLAEHMGRRFGLYRRRFNRTRRSRLSDAIDCTEQ